MSSTERFPWATRQAPGWASKSMPMQGATPVTWTPTVREGEALDDVPLAQWIGEALGAASMCWVGGTGALQFDSSRASAIAKALTDRVEQALEQAIIQRESVPRLGCATTRELLEELQRRGEALMAEEKNGHTVRGADGMAYAATAGALLRSSRRDTMDLKGNE